MKTDPQAMIRLSMADFASDVNRSWAHRHAPWTLTTGHWVTSPSNGNWMWVDETGREVSRYTIAQLMTGWNEIARQSDMTWETMQRIDWMQLHPMTVRGVVSVVCMIEDTVFGVLLKDDEAPVELKDKPLAAIFIALVVMIGTVSGEALAALAAGLGVDQSDSGNRCPIG